MIVNVNTYKLTFRFLLDSWNINIYNLTFEVLYKGCANWYGFCVYDVSQRAGSNTGVQVSWERCLKCSVWLSALALGFIFCAPMGLYGRSP